MISRHLSGPAAIATLAIMLIGPTATARGAAEASEVSQYGVTWTFDEPRPVGQFVTGDWWVVGPVTVVSVTPAPGPAPADDRTEARKNQFGDDGLRDDRSMRNGSMIVPRASRAQGYDSRLKNYDPDLTVTFPRALAVNESLISTVSNAGVDVPNFVADIMWAREKRSRIVLRSAAVLTVLSEPPPPDAFRPPYAGTDKPIHRASDLKWDRLPRLAPAGEVPPWERFERYLQRPWLDHAGTWLFQLTGPCGNQPSYGREWARVVSISSLMLSLDVPRERKERLAIGLVQLGIDMHGLMNAGREWRADGGHWSGRKWPILFAGLMLDDPDMQSIPETAIFGEDQQTYYGRGHHGQTALFQMVTHHGPTGPYEEKPPEAWDAMDKRSESYRLNATSKAWIGTALAAQLMGAKPQWNHDAFFDYCDRWMTPDAAAATGEGARATARPAAEGETFDPFVDAMWAAHRDAVPPQPGGTRHRKWEWSADRTGRWEPNEKPTAARE